MIYILPKKKKLSQEGIIYDKILVINTHDILGKI